MTGNLFHEVPVRQASEAFLALVADRHVRVERIVSQGHSSPDGFWYEQAQHEWVVVLRGAARLRFDDKSVELGPGDYIHIPASTRHRVEWTTRDEPTIWLAVFYGDEPPLET